MLKVISRAVILIKQTIPQSRIAGASILMEYSSAQPADTSSVIRSSTDQEYIHNESHSGFLQILFLDTSSAYTISALPFLECQILIHVRVVFGSMDIFLEDWIGLDSFEFGLEAVDGVTVGAAVGATTSVGKVVAIILRLVTRSSPNAVRQLGRVVTM